MKKLTNPLILIIIPCILIFIGYRLNSILNNYYQVAVDPEYMYLFNGLNLAKFHFKLFHIDNPGTPLQLLFAIVIRFMHPFAGNNELTGFVLNNPEKYLQTMNVVIFILAGLSNYFLGFFTHKFSGRLLDGLVLQLTPFTSVIIIDSLLRVSVEIVLFINISLFLICIIFLMHKPHSTKHIILTGLVTGLVASTKISGATLILVPLFLLATNRQKIIYVGTSIFSFFIWAFPVLLQLHRYYLWIRNITMHTGKYGGGDLGIIVWNSFFANLKTIFSTNHLWTLVVILSVTILFLSILPFNKPFRNKNKKELRLLSGILLAKASLLIIVSKHFSYYYMIPGWMFTVFSFYLIIRMFPEKMKLFGWIAYSGLLIYFAIERTPEVKRDMDALALRVENAKPSVEFINQNLKDKSVIVLNNYYGSPFKEYALLFGAWWSGPDKSELEYLNILKKLYPNTYFYRPDMEQILWWKEKTELPDIFIRNNSKIYLFVGEGMQETREHLFSTFYIEEGFKAKKIFTNPTTKEEFWTIEQKTFEN